MGRKHKRIKYWSEEGWEEGGWLPWGGETYDYDFDRNLSVKNQESDWDYYKRTDIWRGYNYRTFQTLDYKYIEQMANALAAKYKIEVKVGDSWKIDLENKILTYDPLTLVSGTKSRLITVLLHEIGHLRHTEPVSKIEKKQNPFIKKYFSGAFEVLNMFEDFRVDTLMKKSYEGAKDAYDSNKEVVRELAENYFRNGERYRSDLIYVLEETVRKSSKYKDKNGNLRKSARKKIDTVRKKLEERDTLFDYISNMILKGYGEENVELPETGKMKERIKQTENCIGLSEKCKSTFEVLDIMTKKVYPVIEDLFKSLTENQKEVCSIFGSAIGERVNRMLGDLSSNPIDKLSSQNVPRERESGHSERVYPKEWLEGNYDALKNSVSSLIDELVRKLTFLKREEMTLKWVSRLPRGRIATKGLYKFMAGERRLFKNKIETSDTIKSFAFSLSVDASGSMDGERIVNAVRSFIAMSEVFKRMSIPFEVMMFDSDSVTIKNFEEEYSNEKRKKMAGLIRRSGGGTNLYSVFQRTRISYRPEKNKVMIVLSDGGVGNYDYYKPYFQDLNKKNIKYMGVGIDCGDEIVKLFGEKNGLAIDNIELLPLELTNLLKSIITSKFGQGLKVGK